MLSESKVSIYCHPSLWLKSLQNVIYFYFLNISIWLKLQFDLPAILLVAGGNLVLFIYLLIFLTGS